MNKLRIERRRSQRFRCAGEATVYCMKTESTSVGRIADLSLSGCLIHAERNLFSEYQRVEVSFDVDQIFIRLQGFIRNIRADNALGIEFTESSERTKQRLKELIEELEGWRKRTRDGDGEGVRELTASVQRPRL